MIKSGNQVAPDRPQDGALSRADCTADRPPICPGRTCLRPMRWDSAFRDERSAFQPVACLHCGQYGVVATNGELVLFGFRHAFVIGYGTSCSTMTVKLSEAAVTWFGRRGLTPDQIATYAAKWVLPAGRTNGILPLCDDQAVISDCYEHFRRSVLDLRSAAGSVETARSNQIIPMI